ncbi:hypothetical protein ACLOJK_005405 [Asimina triloba]
MTATSVNDMSAAGKKTPATVPTGGTDGPTPPSLKPELASKALKGRIVGSGSA